MVFLLNWSLSSAIAILALFVSLQPPALARGLGWPMPVQIVAGIVILDFSAGYLAHRAVSAGGSTLLTQKSGSDRAYVDNMPT